MKIPVRSHDSLDRRPTFAHPGDAGADLVASERVVLSPGGRGLVATGMSLAIPQGSAGFVLPRSGLAIRSGVTVINAPGLIDAGYRGEVKVALVNHGDEPFVVEVGDRIAQLVIMRIAEPEYVAVDELGSTSRGHGGFGSTGLGTDDSS